MLKKSYLILVSCLFTLSCSAAGADPFRNLGNGSSQATAEVLKRKEAASSLAASSLAASSSTSTPSVEPGWVDGAEKIIGGFISKIANPATKEALEKIEHRVVNNILPAASEHGTEFLTKAETSLKGVVDHTNQAAQHAIDYTGATLQHNLNESVSHTAQTLTSQVIPATEQSLRNAATHSATELKSVIKSTMVACCLTFVAFFGAKIAYDGVNEYLEEDGKNKTKPMIKIGVGTACFAAATYAVYKQFE